MASMNGWFGESALQYSTNDERQLWADFDIPGRGLFMVKYDQSFWGGSPPRVNATSTRYADLAKLAAVKTGQCPSLSQWKMGEIKGLARK